MIEWSVILITGVLGSFHCVGMCGPIALSIGASSTSRSAALIRQVVFSGGRIFTYTTMGVFAGHLGAGFSRRLGTWVDVSAVLAIVAGAFLCFQGLALTGLFARRVHGRRSCLIAPLFAHFLVSPKSRNVFLGGMFTGMLPCGLVYGVLALAASSQDFVVGALIMAVFGVGTVPLMVATGAAGSLVTAGARRKVLRVAAWTVVLAGGISIARGFGFLHVAGVLDSPACPLCR